MTKIIAHRIYPGEDRCRIEPAARERDWMEQTNVKFAYRCLPLVIANQHGYAVYANKPMSFIWNGGVDLGAIQVTEDNWGMAISIFGYGIITFHIMHLIQTEPGYNLYISGAPNFVKPGIQPLTGVVETDWAPYTFTMNWKITEPNKQFTFTPDEPFCFFFPVRRDIMETCELVFDNLADNATLYEQNRLFDDNRNKFYHSEEYRAGQWQKHYFQGKYPDGSACPVNHQTKLNLGTTDANSGNK